MRVEAWVLALCAPGWLACTSESPCGRKPDRCNAAEIGASAGANVAGDSGSAAAAAGAAGMAGGAESTNGGDSGSAGEASGAGAAEGGGAPGGNCDTMPVGIGMIESAELSEISGMVASTANPGVYYVHNDSGDSARFFAIDERGRTLAEVVLSGATAVDWEDIAIGPGPGGGSFVYVADTGDNDARVGAVGRTSIDVYRVAEPAISEGQLAVKLQLSEWERLPLTYPDAPHDCEALLVDPQNAELVLVTKENDGNSLVFRASGLVADGAPQTLSPLTELAFGTAQAPGSTLVTSGSMSATGGGILLRTYSAVFFWARPQGTDVATALAGPPRALAAPSEDQGEAITFSADGASFLTVSESEHSQIFRTPVGCLE